MDTIFMSSENSETSDPHRLLLKLLDQINLKCYTKIINLKCQLRQGMKSLNYLIDHILYQIFKIILNMSLKNMEKRLKILQ